MKTIGLIGGMSWESTAEYYRLMNQEVRTRLGPLRSAQLLIHSVDFGPIAQAQHEGRWDDAGELLAGSARRLHAAGADAIVLCTNTMHKLAGTIAAATPLPFLHIAAPVGEAARQCGLRRLGLLATAFTMEQPFLKDKLAQDHGLQVVTPDAPTRAEVHRVIYEELCQGIVRDASRGFYQRAIAQLQAQGCDAIVLGCTEISLLVQQAHSPLPLLDTTALHARAAVDFALA
ncbi:aspartate racemase [Acidovorax sp. CF316]|uniref:aspartate/glutamate racemase family protein n=1 Tax=Acidovorax sp. CF316 TaxID=1144317 RepID=UPI00026BC360|nr:aspartate/glutamate racemase family protein [Acidovorax sp. CF316]EJE51821.1 aspartate racemase [Acidovorax sp. CF316]